MFDPPTANSGPNQKPNLNTGQQSEIQSRGRRLRMETRTELAWPRATLNSRSRIGRSTRDLLECRQAHRMSTRATITTSTSTPLPSDDVGLTRWPPDCVPVSHVIDHVLLPARIIIQRSNAPFDNVPRTLIPEQRFALAKRSTRHVDCYSYHVKQYGAQRKGRYNRGDAIRSSWSIKQPWKPENR